jgi:iron complex outermembrane receptor protein
VTFLQQVIPAQSAAMPAIAIRLDQSINLNSEEVISYELGYRTTFIDNVSIDFTAFYNDYDDLRSGNLAEPVFMGSYVEVPITVGNNNSGHTYGFEMAAVWQMLDWWRWDANYNLLKTGFSQQDAVNQLGSSPQQRMSLRSIISPWQDIDVDLLFRYVDENVVASSFGTAFIKDYVSLDIRLAWRPIKGVELSLVGQNLLAEQHLEYRQENFVQDTSIDRGVYGKLVWEF